MRRNVFFTAVFILFASGCASLSEQGQKALSEGEYEKALSLYERAAKQDHDDPEAKEGLKKAQRIWIERKLIDVRLLRLGQNLGESETLLLKLIQNENDWQVFPTQAAFSTQAEELQYFADRIHEKIKSFIEKKNPLAAQAELTRNRFVLEKALQQNLAKLEERVYETGKQFCLTAEKSLKSFEYYTALWLRQTCQIWKLPLKEKKLQNSVALFRGLQINSKIQGTTTATADILDQSVKEAFLKSKWFDAKASNTLHLSISGLLESRQSEVPRSRTREYPVQIPYEEASRRPVDYEKKDTGFLGLLSMMSGNSEKIRVVGNGDGTETVYTTKYRTEWKTLHYEAIEMASTKTLQGSLSANLGNQNFVTSLNGNYKFNEDRHSENFPSIGLVPTNPQFITDEDWIRTMSPFWTQQLTAELQSRWINLFCGPPVSKDLSEREQMFRCAYQVDATTPEPLRQFYFKNWEISFENWRQMTKDF